MEIAAHQRWWQIGEVVFGSPFLAALVVQRVVPLSLPRVMPRALFILAGITLALAGIALVASARRELARYGQPTDPGHPTSRVVTTGVFAISRNPLYLGAVCSIIGIALAFDLPWVLVLLLPALAACHYVLIAPEERYLAASFGEEYRTYVASVRRWFGRSARTIPPPRT